MTLSLNCQTILWPIQYSGHPVWGGRLVLERAALRLPLPRTRLRELPWLCLFCHRWSVFQWRACYLEAVTYVQKGVQLVTKVCYYLEFSYIYKHLIINKKSPLLNCRRLYVWCRYNRLDISNLRGFDFLKVIIIWFLLHCWGSSNRWWLLPDSLRWPPTQWR